MHCITSDIIDFPLYITTNALILNWCQLIDSLTFPQPCVAMYDVDFRLTDVRQYCFVFIFQRAVEFCQVWDVYIVLLWFCLVTVPCQYLHGHSVQWTRYEILCNELIITIEFILVHAGSRSSLTQVSCKVREQIIIYFQLWSRDHVNVYLIYND